MDANGQVYLGVLAGFPPKTFEQRFSRIATQLQLGDKMNADELHRLFEAAFSASLCNVAFNGLGGSKRAIRPDRERGRIALEREYMTARNALFSCPSWRSLTPSIQQEAYRVFLRVLVLDENLAREGNRI